MRAVRSRGAAIALVVVAVVAWVAVRGARASRPSQGAVAAGAPIVAPIASVAPVASVVAPIASVSVPTPAAGDAVRAASVAPRVNEGKGAGARLSAVGAMERVAREVCACKDAACADAVQSRYVASLDDHAPLEARDIDDYVAASRAVRDCVRGLGGSAQR